MTMQNVIGIETTVEWADLQAGFAGRLISPGEEDYDGARAVWNGSVDRRPAVIARCTGVADVLRALAFARVTGLTVAVRGGGHNVAGSAVCDGGIVIDLSGMKGMRVDPVSRTAWAQPGLTWGSSIARPRRSVWPRPAAW